MSELPSTFFGNDIETDGVFVILRRMVVPVSETTIEEPCLIISMPGQQPPCIYAMPYGSNWRVFMQWGDQRYLRWFRKEDWDTLLPQLSTYSTIATKEERDAGKIEIVEHYVGAVRKAFQTAGLWRRG